MFSPAIVVIDFGSQTSQLLVRRVREIGVYCEIFPHTISIDKIRALNPQGIILTGGPESVMTSDRLGCDEGIWQLGCPILGICYGMQLMTKHFGGEVVSTGKGEYGETQLHYDSSQWFTHIHTDTTDDIVWMSHGDEVIRCPHDFRVDAYTQDNKIAAISSLNAPYYAVQFHPEVTHSLCGKALIKHFVFDVCQCQPHWTQEDILSKIITDIRATVGKEHVLLALSGGVDSTVCAAILHRAIGEQLHCVFVDHGLLRQHESQEVMQRLETMGVKITQAQARDRFLASLSGVTDPEEKRKVIGHEFIEVFQDIARDMPEVKWLAQGTIYPDRIESAGAGTGKNHLIKSHHNVGGLPEKMDLKLLEPMESLFKDEVRALGELLGLPHDMIYRHPFPGPGLGVRILGEVKPEYVDILQQADHIFIQEIKKHGIYHKISQAFAVFLPVKSVGVVGDQRCYDYVIALRAVETVDFMTARWYPIDTALLSRISSRIINEVTGVSRVVYDVSHKPPATIEWE